MSIRFYRQETKVTSGKLQPFTVFLFGGNPFSCFDLSASASISFDNDMHFLNNETKTRYFLGEQDGTKGKQI